jgi:transcriptional regulator with PAS, ATPase and Fis domain
MIATYPKMSKIFMSIAEEANIQAYNIDASFENAVRFAKEIEPKVDAILSRGATANFIREAVDIPVVFIPITPFDLIHALHKLEHLEPELAFLHYNQKIGNIREIEEMFHVRIHEYIFQNDEDIRRSVYHAKKRGIRTIVGGQVSAKYAAELGLRGISISAGEDAVNRSVQETLQILDEMEKERKRTAQIQAAFGSLAEGLLVMDEQKRMVFRNQALEKLLSRRMVPGQDIPEELLDERLLRVYAEKQPEVNQIKTVKKAMIAVSHRPIFSEGQFFGVVSTYDDVTKIINLEKKIRNEMHMKGFEAKYHFEDILTVDPEMIRLKQFASLIAKTDSSVLIEGESGTGKELFAQSIHNASERASGPFVAVNCAAIPENLLESELFGYEPGAFTGAKKEGKAGLFELAHNGTIFLDEIGELSMPLQTRLLRVLQEREVMRIGGSKILPIDIRVISATNQDLKKKSEEKTFRMDLYYRLNVFNLVIPPLRRRSGDVVFLFQRFLEKYDADLHGEQSGQLLDYIANHSWPGNIRELQNVSERIANLMIIQKSEPELFPDLGDFDGYRELLGLNFDSASDAAERSDFQYSLNNGLKEAVAEIERQIIEQVLEECDNDQTAAAERLKIGKTTLWRKLKGADESGDN